jgi:hypothetical protein
VEALLSDALRQENPLARAEAIESALAHADASSMARLAALYVDDEEVLGYILSRWSELQPATAAEWAHQQILHGSLDMATLEPVLVTWAASDPSALEAWLKDPAHLNYQWQGLEALTAAVFARDPEAAFALAKTFPYAWRFPASANQWLEQHPEKAARMLGDLHWNYTSNQALTKALDSWVKQDPLSAAAWAVAEETKHKGTTGPLTESLLKAWAEHDPAAAAKFYLTLGKHISGDNLISTWAKKDGASALDWVLANARADNRNALITAVLEGAAKENPQRAIGLLNKLPDGAARDHAAESFTRMWAQKDAAAALDWATQLPPGIGRNKSLNGGLYGWLEKDPSAAAAWAKTQPAGSLPVEALKNIMQVINTDFTKAYTWLNELPESTGASVRDGLISWNEMNEDGVIRMLALPEGPHKAALSRNAITRFLQQSPDEAITWALALPIGPERTLVTQTLALVPAVKEAVFWNNLTETKKTDLMGKLQ